VGIVKGFAAVAKPMGFDILAWLSSSKSSIISDDLDALDLVPTMFKINVLHEEKAAFHPLEGNLSLYIRTGNFPGANQFVQAFETWIRWRYLIFSLNIVTVSHNYLSLIFQSAKNFSTVISSSGSWTSPYEMRLNEI